MARYRVKNWKEYQSFRKDRKKGSPWIKLWTTMFGDFHVRKLSYENRWILIGVFSFCERKSGILKISDEELIDNLGIHEDGYTIDWSMFTHFIEPVATSGQPVVNQPTTSGQPVVVICPTQVEVEVEVEVRGRELPVKANPEKETNKTSFNFPIKDSDIPWNLPTDFANKLVSAFPRIDIKSELPKIELWLDSNPTKQKTKRGMTKFLNGWFTRANDQIKPEGPPVRRDDLPEMTGDITVLKMQHEQ